ncbi:MAG TPA: helix-turn-helix domain-containing protein, partial [Reyranella sp.]|nr:helix-turn-helix domain-containing protein [Reyranella sp.]
MLPLTDALSNALLSELSRTAAATLSWEPVALAAGVLPRSASRDFVYFPCSGLMCLHCGDGGRVEVAVVGHTGSTGLALARLDSSVVLEGHGWRVPRAALRGAARSCEHVDALLAADSDSLLGQMIEHLAAATRASVIQRVAHWLLAAEAHSGTDSFRITHEMLAALLAVRRSGVTVALHHLEGSGAIGARRYRVVIRDRSKLRAAAEAFRLVDTERA